MTRLAAVVLFATVGCGATQAPSAAPDVATPSWPTEVAAILSSDVVTLELDVPDTGGVHHCRFRVLERRPVEWLCSSDGWRYSLPLDARTSERLGTLLADVSEWGRPLADDEVRPSTITLQSGRGPRLRFEADPASEPERLRAFQAALLIAAQNALALMRSTPEGCSGCREGEYCEEGYMCETLGPHKGVKNCAIRPSCHRRLPATSRCQHDYECQSGHCIGTSEVVGGCG